MLKEIRKVVKKKKWDSPFGTFLLSVFSGLFLKGLFLLIEQVTNFF